MKRDRVGGRLVGATGRLDRDAGALGMAGVAGEQHHLVATARHEAGRGHVAGRVLQPHLQHLVAGRVRDAGRDEHGLVERARTDDGRGAATGEALHRARGVGSREHLVGEGLGRRGAHLAPDRESADREHRDRGRRDEHAPSAREAAGQLVRARRWSSSDAVAGEAGPCGAPSDGEAVRAPGMRALGSGPAGRPVGVRSTCVPSASSPVAGSGTESGGSGRTFAMSASTLARSDGGGATSVSTDSTQRLRRRGSRPRRGRRSSR